MGSPHRLKNSGNSVGSGGHQIQAPKAQCSDGCGRKTSQRCGCIPMAAARSTWRFRVRPGMTRF